MSDRLLADWRQHALTLETEVNKVVVGQQNPVRLITTAIFARGHVLLEGDVGVGKTQQRDFFICIRFKVR